MKCKIHRCNCRHIWSVQNRKKHLTAKTVLLNGNWAAELKPERKSNPKGFVITQNWQDIIFNPSQKLVDEYFKEGKLIYDKKNIYFNVANGKYLYFAEDGTCYILSKRKTEK